MGKDTRLGRSESYVVVKSAMISALYAVLTIALHPLSFGPLQLRAANVLKPLVLVDPVFAIGFGLGTFIANLSSPFGALDFFIMPFVDIAAGLIAWKLRRLPWIALTIQATIISVGVMIFPLHMGGGVPLSTFWGIFVSNMAVILIGYMIIWRKIIGIKHTREDK